MLLKDSVVACRSHTLKLPKDHDNNPLFVVSLLLYRLHHVRCSIHVFDEYMGVNNVFRSPIVYLARLVVISTDTNYFVTFPGAAQLAVKLLSYA